MDRTFFFRQSYSTKDMYERIYAEDFIREFKQFAVSGDDSEENPEINKKNCFLGLFQAYPDEKLFEKQITRVFNKYGRNGDKLNVKLFRLNSDFKYRVTDEVKGQIESIINLKESIKDKDHLSPGLQYNIFIDDFKFNELTADFRFKIETEVISHDPNPNRIINNIYVELRLYLSSCLLAFFTNDATSRHIKDILKIVHLLFHHHSPKFSEVEFEEAQLIMIQLRLNGMVSSPRYRSDDELRVEIHGINEINYENPVVQLVQNQDKKFRIYELCANCVVSGHRFNLRLSAEGKIQIETYVESIVLDQIIQDIDWVILSKKYYKEIDTQIDLIFRKKSPAALGAQRQQRVRAVINDLHKLFEKNSTKKVYSREIKLVTTILLNIGLFLTEKNIDMYVNDQMPDASEYENLVSFFTDYFVLEHRKNRNQSILLSLRIVSLLLYLNDISSGDAVALIEQHQNLVKDDSECLSRTMY